MSKGRIPSYVHGVVWPWITGGALYAYNQIWPVMDKLLAGAMLASCVALGAGFAVVHFYPSEWEFWRRKKSLPRPAEIPDSGLLLRADKISLEQLPVGPLKLVGLRPVPELRHLNPVYDTDIGGRSLMFTSLVGAPLGYRLHLENHGSEPVTDVQVNIEVEFFEAKPNATSGFESGDAAGNSRIALRAQALAVGETMTVYVHNNSPHWARLIPPEVCGFKSRSMPKAALGKLQVPTGFSCSLGPSNGEVKLAPPVVPVRSLTLFDLFQTDFPQCLRISKPIKFTRRSTGAVTTTETAICRDYEAGSEFLAAYVSRSSDAFAHCCKLAELVPQILQEARAAMSVAFKRAGETKETNDAELSFSGKVYLYLQDDLSLEEMAKVNSLYLAQGLNVNFRGSDYHIMHAESRLEQRLKHLDESRPSHKISENLEVRF